MQRRDFLKNSLAGCAVCAAISSGLLPRTAQAVWPKPAFDAQTLGETLRHLTGAEAHTASAEIELKIQETAENGAVVPVTVTANLPDVESITLLVERNPNPLAASFVFDAAALPFISTRIKMAETSEVIAVVKSGGRLFSASRTVKVIKGGGY